VFSPAAADEKLERSPYQSSQVEHAEAEEVQAPRAARRSLLAMGSPSRSAQSFDGGVPLTSEEQWEAGAAPLQQTDQATFMEGGSSQAEDSQNDFQAGEHEGVEMAQVASSVEEVADLAHASLSRQAKFQKELNEVQTESMAAAQAIRQARSTFEALQAEMKELVKAQDVTQHQVASLQKELAETRAAEAELASSFKGTEQELHTQQQELQQELRTQAAAASTAVQMAQAKSSQMQSVLSSVAQLAQSLSVPTAASPVLQQVAATPAFANLMR